VTTIDDASRVEEPRQWLVEDLQGDNEREAELKELAPRRREINRRKCEPCVAEQEQADDKATRRRENRLRRRRERARQRRAVGVICDVCKVRYSSKYCLDRHKARFHPPPGTPTTFRCGVEGCGKTFRAHHDLLRHTRDIHGPGGPPVCKACNIAFASMCILCTHMREQHKANGRFPCPKCPKILKIKRSIRKHMQDVHGIRF
jgi:uncharacterized C2H2 Zn-finger protein